MLTYLSSHDTGLVRQNLYWQGTAFQLLPGGIQIFYGDETSRPLVSGVSVGGDGHAVRSDMNFGQNADLLAHWQKVGKFRANHVAVGAGSHSMISAYNSSTGYTFSRSYMDDNVTDSVVCCIGAPANTQIAVDVSSVFGNSKTVTNEYDGTTAVVTNGKATFNSGKQGVILISGPQSTISMSLKGAYGFYDSETVTAAIRGADYAMVSVNGGAEFRVTNGQTFEIGAGIEKGTVFEVTMTATNSVETLSKSFSFKKKDPDEVTTIYFDDSQLNWGNIKAYVYDESGSDVIKNAAWPGEAMEYDSSTGLYSYDVPDELTKGLVIFSGDNGRYPGDGAKGLEINETNMIFKAGNSWTPYNGEHVDPKPTEDPNNSVTVYVNAASLGYSSPNIYYWSSKTDSGPKQWPGVAMTKYKDNIFKATFPKEYDMCIFNQNGQTGNLTVPGNNYIYDNGTWTVYEDAEQPTTQAPTIQTTTQAPTTVPVTDKVLVGDANQDGKVNVVDATEIQKHIVEMVQLSGKALKAADTNNDGSVNIKDVTAIQYYAVDNKTHSENCGKMM